MINGDHILLQAGETVMEGDEYFLSALGAWALAGVVNVGKSVKQGEVVRRRSVEE